MVFKVFFRGCYYDFGHQVEIVAIEGTAAVVQSLLIALYVDPADTKAVSQAISQVVEKYVYFFSVIWFSFQKH